MIFVYRDDFTPEIVSVNETISGSCINAVALQQGPEIVSVAKNIPALKHTQIGKICNKKSFIQTVTTV